jgi:hypothetical protein
MLKNDRSRNAIQIGQQSNDSCKNDVIGEIQNGEIQNAEQEEKKKVKKSMVERDG